MLTLYWVHYFFSVVISYHFLQQRSRGSSLNGDGLVLKRRLAIFLNFLLGCIFKGVSYESHAVNRRCEDVFNSFSS